MSASLGLVSFAKSQRRAQAAIPNFLCVYLLARGRRKVRRFFRQPFGHTLGESSVDVRSTRFAHIARCSRPSFVLTMLATSSGVRMWLALFYTSAATATCFRSGGMTCKRAGARSGDRHHIEERNAFDVVSQGVAPNAPQGACARLNGACARLMAVAEVLHPPLRRHGFRLGPKRNDQLLCPAEADRSMPHHLGNPIAKSAGPLRVVEEGEASPRRGFAAWRPAWAMWPRRL